MSEIGRKQAWAVSTTGAINSVQRVSTAGVLAAGLPYGPAFQPPPSTL